jgi:hypothetical protein
MCHRALKVTTLLYAAAAAAGVCGHAVPLAQGRAVGRSGAPNSMHLVSPSVVATWTSRDNPDGSKTRLLVLWRGSPGWLSTGNRGHGFGGGSYDGYWLSSAQGVTFTVAFDFKKATARILNQEISLDDTNVVLIDFADRPSGPAIAGYQRVDFPQLDPAIADPVPTIIQRTPALFEYLQCDVPLSDPSMDTLRTGLCNSVRPIK